MLYGTNKEVLNNKKKPKMEVLVFKAEGFVMRMCRCATRQKESVVITANKQSP